MRARRRRPPPFLLDHPQAARIVGFSPLSIRLSGFRTKHGIPFVKLGALVWYEEAALRQYVARHRVNMPPDVPA